MIQRYWTVSRRKFLGLLSVAGLLRADEPTAAASTVTATTAGPAPGYKILKPAHVVELEAIAENIIPADHDPGAREAGVVHYIDNVLARGQNPKRLPYTGLVVLAGYQSEKLPLYAAGLEGINQTSRLRYGREFVKLSSDRQTSILKSLERGTAQGEVWRSVSSREFFAMVWVHVLEGFYGPPEDGGNKNYASWKMVGYPEHSGAL